MDVPFNNIASSIAGAEQQRLSSREKLRAREQETAHRYKLQPDKAELDAPLDGVIEVDATRRVKGNVDEESHEDREEHLGYNPGGADGSDTKPPLDVEG